MKYNTDKPIEKQEDDLLGRASFSNQLGKAIYGYEEESSLVIGLFGEWGTGKTSIINMVENEILRLSLNGNNEPFIIRFSPWNYKDKDNLISLFFESLQTKLKEFDTKEIYNSVRKALCDYANALDILSYIPGVSPKVVEIIKAIAKGQGEQLEDTPDLDKSRKILEKELIKINRKIIVIIDDIDRLTNIQIRDIFQLVKQVADFPNVIYVLVMDRNVVERALNVVHDFNGSAYLEKIIQVPIELPKLNKSKLEKIFIDRLETILKDPLDRININEDYWNKVFINCISPYISNLRDVNRVINTFQLKYGMLKEELAFEDMIAITVLEVLEPKLYKWIYDKKVVLLQDTKEQQAFSNDISYYSNELNKLGINSNKAINFLSVIFPFYSNDLSFSTFDIRKNLRIADKKQFDMYFHCNLNDIKLSSRRINSFLFEFDEGELENTIEEISVDNGINYFLEEIEDLVEEIPYGRLPIIASKLFLNRKIYTESSKNILEIPPSKKCDLIVIRILDRLNPEDKFQVLTSLINTTDERSLYHISSILYNMKNKYDKDVVTLVSKNEQAKNLEYFKNIVNIYVEKVKEITREVSITDIKGFLSIFHEWKTIDNIELSKYLEFIFESEITKLKFITALASERNELRGRKWIYFPNLYSEFLSNNDIYNSIINFDKKRLHEFTELEKIKLATFVCNHDKGDYDYASEDEARELLKRWELEARIINSNLK